MAKRRSVKRPVRSGKKHQRVPPFSIPACKRFTGYKPCFPGTECYRECVEMDPIGTQILLINLDAMGNVLATTSILPALKRKYPRSTISWITLRNTFQLLQHNPYLDRVYVWEPESWLILQQIAFDVVMNVDKSQRSCALMNTLQARTKLGFGLNKNGVIVPLNKEAGENYVLGLDDRLKFRVNVKTVPQILCEQFRLDYRRDAYTFRFTSAEEEYIAGYARRHDLQIDQEEGSPLVVGFNTGCSEMYPNKKMTIEQHVQLIDKLSLLQGIRLLLLGGPEDTERNAEIVRRVGGKVHSTPTTEGVRRGMCYVQLCDVVISGDSFGMHAAIALKKHVIVWFGVSCATEIDLFGRGTKFVPTGLDCSPCWKKECPYNRECIGMIDLDGIVREVRKWIATESVTRAVGK